MRVGGWQRLNGLGFSRAATDRSGRALGPIPAFKKATILRTRSGVGCMGLFGGSRFGV